MGSSTDPDKQRNQTSPFEEPPTSSSNDDITASGYKSAKTYTENTQKIQPRRTGSQNGDSYPELSYREHVSGPLPAHPVGGPPFVPGYPPQPQYTQPQPQGYYMPYGWPPQPQAHPGYMPTYPPYPGYQAHPPQPYPGYQVHAPQPHPGYQPQPSQPYPGYQTHVPPAYPTGYYAYAPYGTYPQYVYPSYNPPTRARRDGYLFSIAIISLVASCLVLLAGAFFAIILLVVSSSPRDILPANQFFSSIVVYVALATAGIVGGGFSLYHSIRSLIRRPSAKLKLPWFWIFVILYVILITIGLFLPLGGQVETDIPGSIFLIALAGILPALSFLALGLHLLSYPSILRKSDGSTSPVSLMQAFKALGLRFLPQRPEMRRPTSWRRFTIALVSGATLATMLAVIFEFILTLALALGLHLSGSSLLSNPDQPVPHDPKGVIALLLIVSVIAPLVEEAVKPLAVVVLIGRMNSAIEAFILGMSCGIGFDLFETASYISMGYRDWIDVAIQRSTAGLLHGFGAAMVALGWYYLTHRNSANNRIVLGLGCILYAVLQHAFWNGSFLFQLLPAPIGPYLNNAYLTSGTHALPAIDLVYLAESILMLLFFLLVIGKLRRREQTTAASTDGPRTPIAEKPAMVNA